MACKLWRAFLGLLVALRLVEKQSGPDPLKPGWRIRLKPAKDSILMMYLRMWAAIERWRRGK